MPGPQDRRDTDRLEARQVLVDHCFQGSRTRYYCRFLYANLNLLCAKCLPPCYENVFVDTWAHFIMYSAVDYFATSTRVLLNSPVGYVPGQLY